MCFDILGYIWAELNVQLWVIMQVSGVGRQDTRTYSVGGRVGR